MAAKPHADEPATDGDDEQNNERTETVEVELAPADVERIELEIEETDAPDETVGEWIARRVRIEFSRINHRADRHIATPEVDVPPLLAERARLEYESARQRGKDSSLVEVLMNEVEVHPDYRVNGYRIETDDSDDE